VGDLDSFSTAQMVSLVGFAVLILLALIPRLKSIGFGQSAKMALSWVLIFGGLIFLVAQWPTLRSALDPASPVIEGDELRLRAREDGHYYIRGEVNGEPTTFLVDTGATDIVLTMETAARAGWPEERLTFDGMASTANGLVPIAGARLESLEIGGLLLSDQRVSVNRGRLDQNLLGMAFLNQLSGWRVENGELILVP
jgi:aspartyl protease family protein